MRLMPVLLLLSTACITNVDELLDRDGDGYGSNEADCDNCTDCDDSDVAVHPQADEIYDGVDNDCDGDVDIAAIDDNAYFVDEDGDGFGSIEVRACEQPDGTAIASGDCDDADDRARPNGNEVCDGVDNDCDGDVDDADPGLTGVPTWFADGDGDGYGDVGAVVEACTQPSGYADNDGDCDDGDPAVKPGASEDCNGIDDDCDGDVDSDDDDFTGVLATWYQDTDGDGFGSDTSTESCTPPIGYVALDGDCDDTEDEAFPGAFEWNDGFDNSCDGDVDEIDADTLTFWPGAAAGDEAGSVWNAGDVNGDGVADLAVGASMATPAGPGSGAVYLVTDMTALGALPDIGVSFAGSAGSRLGVVSSGHGDIDNDGYDDLLSCAFAEDGGRGAAHLVYGSPNVVGGPIQSVGASLTGDVGDSLGLGCTIAGDVNADGFDDIWLGATGADSGDGMASLVFGGSGRLTDQALADIANATFTAEQSGDGVGNTRSAGDINGDGFDDLLVGAFSQGTGGTNAGAGYLIFGRATIGSQSLDDSDARYHSEEPNGFAGALEGAGDLNGDGLSDIVYGVRAHDAATGAAFIFHGHSAPTSAGTSGADAVVLGAEAGGEAGWGASGAGDMDGDGTADLLVGVIYDANAGASSGAMYIFQGPVSGTQTVDNADAAVLGPHAEARLGVRTAGGFDFDDDGFSDVVVGSFRAATTGGAFLLLGGP